MSPKTAKKAMIVFRLTQDERKAVEVIANREGYNPSELMRLLIHEGLKMRGLSQIGLINLLGEQTTDVRPDAK